MKYRNLILIAVLLLANSHNSLASSSGYDYSDMGALNALYPSDRSGFSMDNSSTPLEDSPSSSEPSLFRLNKPFMINASESSSSSEASSLAARRASVGSMDSCPSNGDLEEELRKLIGSPAEAPAPQAEAPAAEDSSDDETFDLSSDFLRKLYSPEATPTEFIVSDESEGESVPPAPKTPVPTLAALPAVFQPFVAAPATVGEPSRPSNRLMPKSPNMTPSSAGEKRKRIPEAVSMPPKLVRALSYEPDNG